MIQSRKPAVVVGVDESLAGLAALRYAVAEARRRGLPVRAVRVRPQYSAPRGWEAGFCQPAVAEDACAVIRRAFESAMFGLPEDLAVDQVVVEGDVATELLAQAAADGDLLVVGAPRRRPWRLPWFSESRRCVGRASCPVIIVPPPAPARVQGRRALAREVLREASRLVGT